MSEKNRTELDLKIQNRIFAFLKEMVAASDQMFTLASSEDGKGIKDVAMHDRAMILVDMQADVIDYLIEFSGESEENILVELEISRI